MILFPYDIEPYIFPNEEILNKKNIHSHYLVIILNGVHDNTDIKNVDFREMKWDTEEFLQF